MKMIMIFLNNRRPDILKSPILCIKDYNIGQPIYFIIPYCAMICKQKIKINMDEILKLYKTRKTRCRLLNDIFSASGIIGL